MKTATIVLLSLSMPTVVGSMALYQHPPSSWQPTAYVGSMKAETDLYSRVAEDVRAQYMMVRRNGNAVEMCVYAGLVAAAYLQARDEAHYAAWKQAEANDCRHTGIAR